MILEREEERQREGVRERERENYQCERETSISCLLYTPLLGTDPKPLVYRWDDAKNN